MPKQTKLIMGMPITVEIVDSNDEKFLADTFDYFRKVDKRFSTYKKSSEISQINRGLPKKKWSREMKTVMRLCEYTTWQTSGYFDIKHFGQLDPSGLVKGWAIQNAAQRLLAKGIENFYIEAGGDIQAHGKNADGEPWRVGIRNPFNIQEIIKTLTVSNAGIATSGTYIRGQHIYDPNLPETEINDVKSLTVVGPNIYEADRFATAAFAMGKTGISFIESLPDLEGYMVDENKIATFTSGFEKYVHV
ncbi:MAG: FAD:protein FMN transferase [Candidatus Saccharimonadales bacterium]